MKQQVFENKYRNDWIKFADMLQRHKSKQGLTVQERESFTREYRHLCYLLAIANERHYSGILVQNLNDLALQGHQLLYQSRRVFLPIFMRFLLQEFPQLVRKERFYFWLAALLLYGPTLFVGFAVYIMPELIYSVFDPGDVNKFEYMYDPESSHYGKERAADSDLAAFGFYIKNNISVGFNTFASGLMFGFGTVFLLVYNGVFLGSVAAHLIHLNFSETFFSFVIGHGSFELTAIVIAGAAGLKIGKALILPGRHKRINALKQQAGIAVKLVYGSIVLLVLAAFVEAYWSSSSYVSANVKYMTGAVLWFLVIAYLTLAGRYGGSE